jgi:hypothetical protein
MNDIYIVIAKHRTLNLQALHMYTYLRDKNEKSYPAAARGRGMASGTIQALEANVLAHGFGQGIKALCTQDDNFLFFI